LPIRDVPCSLAADADADADAEDACRPQYRTVTDVRFPAASRKVERPSR
jgi:hypothetical protein